MNLFKKFLLPLQLAIVVLITGLVSNGCFDSEVAGTSTTTGNTITARVLLSDGRPAVGAKVSIRQSGFIPREVPGNSANTFSKDTITDPNGFFTVPAPTGLWYFLDVYQEGTEGETYWQDSVSSSSKLTLTKIPKDTLRLSKSGVLSGQVVVAGTDSIWLGFPGTTHFKQLKSDGAFSFDSLPPGSRSLRLIRSQAGTTQSIDIQGWTALSNATVILDTIVLPPDTSVHRISLPACLDKVDSLVFVKQANEPSDTSRIFRSVLRSSPPKWVQLDACLGHWSEKAALTQAVSGNFELIAGHSADYLILPDSSRIIKLSAISIQTLPSFPTNMAQANFHAGRFYAFFHLDSALRSFPDEAAWLGKQFDRSYPKPNNFQRFAINDSAIHYLISDSTGYSLSRYNFNSGAIHTGIPLSNYSGNYLGMAAGSKDDIWLLNDARELIRFESNTGRTLLKARVIALDSLRGLAGGN